MEDITELANQNTLRERMLPMARRVDNSIENHPLDPSNQTYSAIAANKKRRVITNLPFGTLNQPAWLPLHLTSGIVIELEFDDASTAFAEANANWICQDVSLLANLHTIDSSLANSYASHVLKGNPLHLHFTSVVATRHIAPGPSFAINLVRGFTRLRQFFWTYVAANGKKSKGFQRTQQCEL